MYTYLKVKEWRKNNPKKYKEQCRKIHQKKKDTPKFRYHLYIKSAKERKLDFNLSFEEFMNFWKKPCYYCRNKIETIGIDRINNRLGYIIENLRSCCYRCNIMKKNYTEKEFINQCKIIANNFNEV